MTSRIPSYSVRLTQSAVALNYQRSKPNPIPSDINFAPTSVASTNLSVAENTPLGFLVGTLSVVDANPGQTHIFKLVDDAGGRFALQGNKLLRTAVPLDYEAAPTHSITVRATDPGGLYVDQVFTIAVINVAEQATDITLSARIVDENAVVDTTVGTFAIVGADASSTYTYTLSADAGGRFKVVSGVLKVAALGLNYETGTFHDITVVATDQFNNTITKSFVILVANVNEAPSDIQLSNLSVPENVAANYVIGSLSVTDPDPNGTITFSLTDTAGNRFAISGSDLIRGATALDYETATSHSITVRATDQDGLFFDKTFTISVADVLESGPANTAPTDITLSNSSVDEHAAAGTVVGQFAVVDAGTAQTHTLVLTNDAGGRFAISTNKELIVGLNPIEFENGDQTITVRATDQGGLSFVKSFTITVRDVPEAPTGININATVVNENSPPGTVIGGLSTIDPDAVQSFTYSLTTDHGGRFAINGNNLVTGATPLDYELASQYIVEVKSTDQSGLSYIKQFSINVLDISEGSTGGGGSSVVDKPSTWNPVIPWLVAGKDFPVGRISTNPLKNPAGIPGINGAGSAYTYITAAGIYEDIDFGATKVACHVSGVTFRQCKMNDGWAPAPPPYGQGPEVCGRYHQDGARVDFNLEWCDVYGTKRGTSVSPLIDNNNGVTNCYRCALRFGASDGFKVGGGHIYECCYELGGYDPGAHQDGMEVTKLVANLEVYRCYFDVEFYGDPNSGSNGAIKFYVEAGQPSSNLPAGLDLLFEENVCHANAGPNCSNYILRPGTTGGSTGRFLNNFVSKWQTWPTTAAGNFWTGDANYNTIQGTKDHFRNGLALADISVGTKPQAPVLTSSSPNSTSITLVYTDIVGASYHEYRIRPVGSARWSMCTKVPSGKTITGLISNVEYEFKVRAVAGRTTGDWSNTKTQQVGAATAAPGMVSNLAVAQANSNGFLLSFGDAPNATSYQYRVATGSGAAPNTPSTAIPGGGVRAPYLDYSVGRQNVTTMKVPGVDAFPAGMAWDPAYSGRVVRCLNDDMVVQDWDFSNHRIELWGKRIKVTQNKFGRGGVPTWGTEASRDFPAAILVKSTANDFDIQWNTFNAQGSALPGSSSMIAQDDQTIKGKVLYNFFDYLPSDGIVIKGGEIAYNYIGPNNGRNTGSHYDGIEFIGCNFPTYIHDNYIVGTGVNGTNSCIKLYEELGAKYNADIYIYNNYFKGGGHQIMTFDGAANNGFYDGPGVAHIYDNYFYDDTIYGAGGYITNAAFSPGNPTPKSVRFTRNKRVGSAATTLGVTIPDINPEVLGSTFSDWAVLSAKTITGLAPTTAYTIEVRAVNGGAVGNAVSISGTTAAASAPGAMGTISLVSKTDISFTVSFTAIAGANSYEYRKKNPIGGGTFGSFAALPTSGTGVLNATIGGLTASTGYDIEIRAVNTTGVGTASTFSNTTDATPAGDADATALISRMTAAGATPNSGYQSAYTALITALKNAGIWSSVITAKMAAVHSGNVTHLDWKNSAYDGTKVGTVPTFTPKVGYGNDYSFYMSEGLAASSFPSSCTLVARGVGPFGATWDNAYIGGNQSHYISLDTTTGYPVTRYRHDSHTTGPNVDARGKDIFLWGDTSSAHVDVNGTVFDYGHSNVVDTANIRFLGRGGQYSAGCLCTGQHFWVFDRVLTATERGNFRTAMDNYFTAIGGL